MRRVISSHLGRAAMPALVLLMATAWMPAQPARAAGIVDHPEKLKLPDLVYEPPRPADYRHRLAGGITAFIAENHEVPTFELTIIARTGSMYEPVEKAGLAAMTAHLMRNGGVEGMTASEMDERLAFLAGSVSVSIGESLGRASLFCLVKDMDEGLEILKKVLRSPVFDEAALERHRADVLSGLEQRNASTSAIESREWAYLMYGDHPATRQYRQTARSIQSISRDDLSAFHRKYFFPRNFTVAVSGDFETAEVIEKLNRFFADWPDPGTKIPEIPDKIADPRPGVYMVPKAEVNQSRIRIGHMGVKRDVPDQYALLVMNEILGGGGFSSRITRRVRSDEGLAYSTGSRFDRPVLYPGTFRAWFQTKHATAAFGSALIVGEIERIRNEKCGMEEIKIAQAGLVAGIDMPFSSKNRIVNTFADDFVTGRPDKYWQDYKKNIEAVKAADVQAVARKYLHPQKLVFLVVGDPAAVQKGSDKHEEQFSDFGEIEILPLRDPVTLESRPSGGRMGASGRP